MGHIKKRGNPYPNSSGPTEVWHSVSLTQGAMPKAWECASPTEDTGSPTQEAAPKCGSPYTQLTGPHQNEGVRIAKRRVVSKCGSQYPRLKGPHQKCGNRYPTQGAKLKARESKSRTQGAMPKAGEHLSPSQVWEYASPTQGAIP